MRAEGASGAAEGASREHVVGRSVPRVDGVAKVTGAARYVDDLPRMPGELFGATIRSPVPRGVLRSVGFDPAFDARGVTLVRAEDLGVNVVALIEPDQPILAARELRHAYEPIALVACDDPQKLARAVAAVRLDIEELEAVLDPEAALAAGLVQKRYLVTKGAADVGGDADARARASETAIDEILARSAVIVTGRYATGHQEQLYIEPQGVVAWWDEAGVHATGSIQCPYYVH
ncbi:MAG TPA: molybdopterin cofactor-binding domain-containing protein, partial [Minicystis sp.]|nr:molybdopterin cofactor-binding domain-containing protein [Minicystis sp.]